MGRNRLNWLPASWHHSRATPFTTIALLLESVISTRDGLVGRDNQEQSVCGGLFSFRCRACSHVRVDLDGRKEISGAICQPGDSHLKIVRIEFDPHAVSTPSCRG